MLKKTRDDFKASVKQKLAKRVNYLCSNPDCRSLTLGPKHSDDGSHSIGVASHILAAAPLGPRYDGKMSSDERKNIKNGIWLCNNCSTKIDKDELSYSPETLRGWKALTEAFVLDQQGRKYISAEDVTNTLTTALTGYPKKLIPNAVKYIHNAASETLEALDGRFQVLSSYINNQEVYELRAKETTSIKMSVIGDDASAFYAQYKSLLETGSELEISSSNLFFTGSKLFEEMLSGQNGVLRISPKKRDAVVKLHATNPITSESIFFDEIRGHVHVGSKQFSFKGEACKGLIKLSITHSIDRESNASNCSILVDLDVWQNEDVSKIPFFTNVFEFVETIFVGAQLNLALEVEGHRITAGRINAGGDREIMGKTYCLLKFTRAARAISTKFNTPLQFDHNSPFSEDDYLMILGAERLINGQFVLTEADFESDITIDFVVNENVDDIKKLFDFRDIGQTVKIEEPAQSMCIFNREVTLPSKEILLHPVILKPLSESHDVKIDSTIKVQLIPQEGFKMTTLYNYS
ncbi:MAG: hypothetical protein CTY33_02845 [Methylotenera sp.]|nr:MAG: hypothetical protein CTY33_02845 [Methylotenera sp.]